MHSIKKLQLDECNWETQESCEELANIIAEDSRLENLRIFTQNGNRRIEVEVQKARVATGGEQRVSDRGFVRIFEPQTGATICKVNTWRTEDILIQQ